MLVEVSALWKRLDSVHRAHGADNPLGFFSHLIGRIISASALASLYGAASSVIVALLWMYYSVWIALFGAELCRAWDEATARVRP